MTALNPSRRRAVLAVVALVNALTFLDLAKLNVALPSIEATMGASRSHLTFLVAGFMLAMAVALVPAGRLGDRGLRRNLLLFALALFLVGSLGAAVAPSPEWLVIARMVQGAAAGIQVPQGFGFVQTLYEGAARGRVLALLGVVFGLSTAAGPTTGGVVMALASGSEPWRAVFWVNVPVAAIILVLAVLILPREPSAPRWVDLDLVGVGLFTVLVVTFLWPFAITTGRDDDPARWWLLGAFALAIVPFVAWEQHHRSRGGTPLVDPRFFRIRSFRFAIVVSTAFFAAMPAMFLLVTLYLQNGLRLRPLQAGVVTLGFALASALTSALVRRWVVSHGLRMMVGGVLAYLGGLGLLVLAAGSATAAPGLMAAALTAAGVGGGLTIVSNQSVLLSGVPRDAGGLAASVSQLAQRVGGAVGVAVALSVFFAVIGSGPREEAALSRAGFEWAIAAVALLLVLCLTVAAVDMAFVRRRSGDGDPLR